LPELKAAFPLYTDTLRGVCHAVYRIEWREGVFFSLPARAHVVTGKTSNPVEALKDYMTNNIYGLGFDPTWFDTSSWDEAKQYCNIAGWTLNYAIISRRTGQDIVDTILLHFRGVMTWFGGKLYLRYSDLRYESVVGSISMGSIARDKRGSLLFSVKQPGASDTPDGYATKYVNPYKKWTIDDFYVGEKTGKVSTLNLLGFTKRGQAVAMANYLLARAKDSLVVTLTLKPDTVGFDIHDLEGMILGGEIF